MLLTLVPVNEPYIDPLERVTVERLTGRVVRVHARFGYMESPKLKPILTSCAASGLHIDDLDTAYVVAAPRLIPAERRPMPAPRRWLFDVMQRLSGTLPDDLEIPADRLVQLGVEVRI